MIKQKELVPKRQFKEFQNTDSWEQRKLNDVTKKIGSGKTPRGGSSVYIKSGIPLLRSQNINNDRVDFEDVVYITEFMDEEMSNSRIKQNDILLNITGASIGRSAVYELAGSANVNQHVCIIRPNKEINPYFIQLNLTSIKGQKQIDVNQAGGAREGLNFQQVGKINFAYPKYKEQQKIGQFFKHLDEMITLEQRKIDKTKALKSAYLAEMFPAEGERVPKRRFKGFTGEWEKHDLGELTKINTGESDAQDSTVDGKYPFFVRSENIQRSDRYTFDGEAILIPGEGRLGDIYHYFVGKFDYHQRVYKISDFAGELDGKFTLYTMHKTFKKHALKNTVKATVDSLRLPVITEYELLLPTKKEQIKIASLFTNLDNIITTHEKKLAKLKATKQAYLHEMFV